MAVFVLVAAALCQHPPAPPTAKRTTMGQDLGQIKALTGKEKGEIFTGQLILFQIYNTALPATAVVQVGEFPRVLLVFCSITFAHILSHFLHLFIVPWPVPSRWSWGLFVSQSCSLVWRFRLILACYSPCKDGPAALPINTSVCLGWLMLFSDTPKAPLGNKDVSSCCMYQLWHALYVPIKKSAVFAVLLGRLLSVSACIRQCSLMTSLGRSQACLGHSPVSCRRQQAPYFRVYWSSASLKEGLFCNP